MLKKGDDLVVASTGLKRKRASTKEKKSATKYRRRSDSKEGGCDVDDDVRRTIKKGAMKKASIHNETSTSPESDRGYLCDSESESDAKRVDADVGPQRKIRLGKGDLNDLFKVAAKERSNLQRQAAAAAAAAATTHSSPTTTKPTLVASGPVGAPSKAPAPPSQQQQQKQPTSPPLEWDKTRAAAPHSMIYPPHPESLTAEMASAYLAQAQRMQQHLGVLPAQLLEQQKGMLQANIQHQHQHHHEHQHLHQHQHQFSLAPPPAVAAGGSAISGPSYGPPVAGGSDHLHQVTMPYGGIGSGGAAAKTTSSNDAVIGGSGSSAFQPKKPAKWCCAHGRIAWKIFKMMKMHVEKEMQVKAEAAALGAMPPPPPPPHPPAPEAFGQGGRGAPPMSGFPGSGVIPHHPHHHSLFGMDPSGRGLMPVPPPPSHPIPGLMSNVGPEGIHLAMGGMRMAGHLSGTTAARPNENDAAAAAAGHSFHGSAAWGGATFPKDSSSPKGDDKMAVAAPQPLPPVSGGGSSETKVGKGGSISQQDVDPRFSHHHHHHRHHPFDGLNYGKGGSSAFSNVGSGPSIGSGLGIGAFVGQPPAVGGNNATASVRPPSTTTKPALSATSPPSIYTTKTESKPERDQKPAKKPSESPQRNGQRESPRSTTESPQQLHQHHQQQHPHYHQHQHQHHQHQQQQQHGLPPPHTALMGGPMPLAFGYHPSMASFGPSQPGHMLGIPAGPFVGFPPVGHGSMMPFHPPPHMMNFHHHSGSIPHHRMIHFDEKTAGAVGTEKL